MTRFVLACLPVLAVLLGGCHTANANQGPAGDYQVFPAGGGKFQLVVRGHGTSQAQLLERLHARASAICGRRGYSISPPTATGSGSLLGPLTDDRPLAENTMSALVDCGPSEPHPVASAGPSVAPDGRPYCPELAPELERLRPADYVSPQDGDCVPRPKPIPDAPATTPPAAPSRLPVTVPTADAASTP